MISRDPIDARKNCAGTPHPGVVEHTDGDNGNVLRDTDRRASNDPCHMGAMSVTIFGDRIVADEVPSGRRPSAEFLMRREDTAIENVCGDTGAVGTVRVGIVQGQWMLIDAIQTPVRGIGLHIGGGHDHILLDAGDIWIAAYTLERLQREGRCETLQCGTVSEMNGAIATSHHLVHQLVGILHRRFEKHDVTIRDDPGGRRLEQCNTGDVVLLARRDGCGGLIAARCQDGQCSGKEERKNFHCFLERMSEVGGSGW